MATYNGLNDAARYALSAASEQTYWYNHTKGSWYRQNHVPGQHKVVDRRTVNKLEDQGFVEVAYGRLFITEAGTQALREANRKRIAAEGSDD